MECVCREVEREEEAGEEGNKKKENRRGLQKSFGADEGVAISTSRGKTKPLFRLISTGGYAISAFRCYKVC